MSSLPLLHPCVTQKGSEQRGEDEEVKSAGRGGFELAKDRDPQNKNEDKPACLNSWPDGPAQFRSHRDHISFFHPLAGEAGMLMQMPPIISCMAIFWPGPCFGEKGTCDRHEDATRQWMSN